MITNCVAPNIHKDLSDDKDSKTENDITERPTVLQSVQNQQKLHHQIYSNADGIKDVKHDKQADSLGRIEPCPSLEGEERDDERDGEHGGGSYS